jgi:hypothetical protein
VALEYGVLPLLLSVLRACQDLLIEQGIPQGIAHHTFKPAGAATAGLDDVTGTSVAAHGGTFAIDGAPATGVAAVGAPMLLDGADASGAGTIVADGCDFMRVDAACEEGVQDITFLCDAMEYAVAALVKLASLPLTHTELGSKHVLSTIASLVAMHRPGIRFGSARIVFAIACSDDPHVTVDVLGSADFVPSVVAAALLQCEAMQNARAAAARRNSFFQEAHNRDRMTAQQAAAAAAKATGAGGSTARSSDGTAATSGPVLRMVTVESPLPHLAARALLALSTHLKLVPPMVRCRAGDALMAYYRGDDPCARRWALLALCNLFELCEDGREDLLALGFLPVMVETVALAIRAAEVEVAAATAAAAASAATAAAAAAASASAAAAGPALKAGQGVKGAGGTPAKPSAAAGTRGSVGESGAPGTAAASRASVAASTGLASAGSSPAISRANSETDPLSHADAGPKLDRFADADAATSCALAVCALANGSAAVLHQVLQANALAVLRDLTQAAATLVNRGVLPLGAAEPAGGKASAGGADAGIVRGEGATASAAAAGTASSDGAGGSTALARPQRSGDRHGKSRGGPTGLIPGMPAVWSPAVLTAALLAVRNIASRPACHPLLVAKQPQAGLPAAVASAASAPAAVGPSILQMIVQCVPPKPFLTGGSGSIPAFVSDAALHAWGDAERTVQAHAVAVLNALCRSAAGQAALASLGPVAPAGGAILPSAASAGDAAPALEVLARVAGAKPLSATAGAAAAAAAAGGKGKQGAGLQVGGDAGAGTPAPPSASPVPPTPGGGLKSPGGR